MPGTRSNELQRAEEMVGPCPSCLLIHSSCPGKNLLSVMSEPVRRRFANVLYGLCTCQWPGSLLWESLNSRELSFTTNHQKGLQLSPGTRDGQTDGQVVRPSKLHIQSLYLLGPKGTPKLQLAQPQLSYRKVAVALSHHSFSL